MYVIVLFCFKAVVCDWQLNTALADNLSCCLQSVYNTIEKRKRHIQKQTVFNNNKDKSNNVADSIYKITTIYPIKRL